MTRLALVAVCWLVATARADSDRVVLPPVGSDPVLVERVAAALGKVAGLTVGANKPIDQTCIADPLCIATAGAAEGARQVLVISVRGQVAANLDLELVLVDVSGKELVGRRPVTIPPARLGATILAFFDEGPNDRAKSLFVEGNEHYNLGEFAPALELYRRAYRIKPLPAFLFNIAQCHRKLLQYKEAIAMYESYLVGVPDATNKKLVEELIAESRAGQQTVDDRAAAAAKLAAERAAAEAARKAKEAEAVAAANRAREASIEAERDRKLYDQHPLRLPTYIVAGVGAAAVIGGGVFGLTAASHQDAFDNAKCGDPEQHLGATALAACVDERDRGRRAATLANVLLIGGSTLVAASVVVFVLDPGNVRRPKRDLALRVGPGSISARIRW